MLTPNPKRQEMRERLVRIRRAGRAALLIYRKTESPVDLETRKNFRRTERRLSRDLAACAPYLNESGEPFWREGHFKRFRHSGRFAKFKKVWNGVRSIWKRKGQ